MTEDELNQVLSSKNKTNKEKVLLTQVGYMRINLFAEYYERSLISESEKDYDRAIKLMDEYIKTIAAPFIPTKKQSNFSKKLKTFFAVKVDLDPVETMKEWNDDYEIWFRMTGTRDSWLVCERLERYRRIKQTFVTLCWLSFSYRNFPPVTQEPAH